MINRTQPKLVLKITRIYVSSNNRVINGRFDSVKNIIMSSILRHHKFHPKTTMKQQRLHHYHITVCKICNSLSFTNIIICNIIAVPDSVVGKDSATKHEHMIPTSSNRSVQVILTRVETRIGSYSQGCSPMNQIQQLVEGALQI